ncbi:MAG: DUF2934 domain-containing protein [Burkholderiaceae bacterium]|nr:DUF2934 domain-containing protein [Burkholderiaceae bacterium]
MTPDVRAPRTSAAPATRSRKRPAGARTAAPTPETSAPAVTLTVDPVPPDLRFQWVAEAAYYIAERRGFRDGSPEDDWSQAEAQIERLLAAPPA